MPLKNTYRAMGAGFYQDAQPGRATEPELLLWNESLAKELNITQLLDELDGAAEQSSPDKSQLLAELFVGNSLLPGSKPIALAYAGHQFGGFSPQLGDGRAHLLGEVTNGHGQLYDLQLKGSGPTPFSRGGDGRCALGPALREFLMSEALHALNVPTARSLALVSTGDAVYRETSLPGAVVTRVASSHLRVGTFEFFAARKNTEALKVLCDFAIARHYPDIEGTTGERALKLLTAVIEKQIHLVTEWMRIGFIHGVMNTDNTAISGETIDFGPCAMMGTYDPKTVYSSIDTQGRYAFGNQPAIVQWNMTRLAECLLPLISDDEDEAFELATESLQSFAGLFGEKWRTMMAQKLGLSQGQDGDDDLVDDLLKTMTEKKLDYTGTFHDLTLSWQDQGLSTELATNLGKTWLKRWQTRAGQQSHHPESTMAIMQKANPAVIPRNHQVELAIQEFSSTLDPKSIADFMAVLQTPYRESELTKTYQGPASDGDCHYQTFCGT